MPEAIRKQQEMEAKSATAVKERQSGRGMRESSDSKEGHLKTIISALTELKNKWLPTEPVQGRINGRRFRVPVAAMSGLAVFTLSLGLIVGGSVMIGSASGDVGKLNSEISVLEAQQADLEGKLDLKYNINEIEEEAKSLGMIKREHADNQYIPTRGDNEVIIYEENKEQNVGLSALLTAIGVFDRIAKAAGAGTLVPITGFANAVVSAAIDAKSEGFILGLGSAIFTVAGPVLLYGTAAGTLYGVIYWITKLF
jgi:hypothetical protein